MEANELKCNNLVFYKGKVITITMIGEFGIQSNHNGVLINAKFATQDLTPIPLTHEWLIKLGYTSDEPIFSDKPNFYRKGGHEIWRPFHRFLDELYRVEIKYVHQLQNLYFATQQEELKLEQS